MQVTSPTVCKHINLTTAARCSEENTRCHRSTDGRRCEGQMDECAVDRINRKLCLLDYSSDTGADMFIVPATQDGDWTVRLLREQNARSPCECVTPFSQGGGVHLCLHFEKLG